MAKKLPLPKRFSVGLTETAYGRLRDLNSRWHFGNNYLLTIILENFDEIVADAAFERVMERFISEYGQPPSGGMRSRSAKID